MYSGRTFTSAFSVNIPSQANYLFRQKKITYLKKQSIQVHKPMPLKMMISSERLPPEITGKWFLSSMY